MNKILAYYSLIVLVFCVLMCLFDSQGDEETFIGGIMFIPVAYSVYEMITELRGIEADEKKREEIRKYEAMRAEIKEELKK